MRRHAAVFLLFLSSALALGQTSWIFNPYTGMLDAVATGAGSGTVTSVGLSLPAIFTVTGSPVNASGTLTGTLTTQAANTVWAGPVSGGAAVPTFRGVVASDLPNTTVTPGAYTSANITIDAQGRITAAANGTGSAVWGSITGTLSAQTDLNTALNARQPLDSDLTSIAALTTTAFGRGLLDDVDAPASRTSLGATTLGSNFFTLANPAAIRFVRINSDDSISLLDGPTFLTAIGAVAPVWGAITGTLSSQTDLQTALAARQPLDADLTIYAGITPSANVQSFLGAATYAAMRTQLSLVPGTDVQAQTITATGFNGNLAITDDTLQEVAQKVDDLNMAAAVWGSLTGTLSNQTDLQSALDAKQPLDADLTAIAALTTTAFGRGLLDDTDATAARVTLGLVIGTNVLAPNGSGAALTGITGAQVAFADTDGNFAATTIGSAVEELDDVNALGPNATDGKTDWSQLTNVPAGFADGVDAAAGGSAWGAITGTLSAQTDLQTALNGKQPLDNELTSIAGLTTASDTSIYFSGAGVAATYPLSSFARTFLDDTSASAVRATIGAGTGSGDLLAANNLSELTATAGTARSNLGLAIGTNVQAFDTDLTTFAGITPSANVQSLLGAATYAAMRTQLTLVPGTDVQVFDADLTSIAAAAGTNTIYYRSAANTWSPVTIGTNLTFTSGTLAATGGGGGGDVTAALAFGTDNVLIKSDGTGKGVQSTGITVDDSNNIAGIGALTTTSATATTLEFEGATADTFETTIAVIDPTADRTFTLPNASGTALISTDIGASVQAFDTDLTTYAGITPSANVQSLLGAANYAAMRTQLGLVIGTDVLAPTGSGQALTLNATGFNGNLTTTDDTIQEVAQKVDDLVLGGGSGDITSVGNVTSGAAFDGTQGTIITFDDPEGDMTIQTNATANTIQISHPIDIGALGVRVSGDGDGAITFQGIGTGAQENFTINLDDTTNEIQFSTASGATFWRFSGIGIGASLFTGTAADPADSGLIRLGNTETLAWEAQPASTDLTFGVNTSEEFVFSSGLNVTGGGIFSGPLSGSNLSGTNTGDQSGANPTASVGLSAVNGAASTFMRSDGAPALSQSITPTWSGLHIFDDGVDIKNGATTAGLLRIYEDSDDGTDFASFSVPPLAANTVYTLPPDDGTSGQVLHTNGSGVLTWDTDDTGGGGVSDGDKGDVTVSGSGTVWTIDDGVTVDAWVMGSSTATTPAANDNDTSLATTAYVQTEVDGTQTGVHATPSTTTPLSPTWSGPMHTVWYGATGTVNLPAASGYSGRGILIYNTGAFTITIDPNASEVVIRDGTVQTGGVSFTLSTGAGNYVALISDGARWITLGFKGTLAVGS